MNRSFIILVFCTLIGLSSEIWAQVGAEEKTETGFDWYLDIAVATFLGNNSYFGESVSFTGANTDDWSEAVVELGLKGHTSLGKGTFFGEFSGLVSKTWGDDASGLTVGLDRTHEADIEQAHIGWRSGSTFSSLDSDALTFKVGSVDYVVGSGLLIADGTADGGYRGGWFLSGRTAFRRSFLTTLQSGAWKADGFYLQGEGRGDDERVYAYGGNFEYGFKGAGLNTGLLYFKVPDQRVNENSYRERVESLSLRGDWAATDNLGFAGEYVYQSRPGTHPGGWYLMGAYKWNGAPWTPELSYRYAAFDGDDLSTPEDESFDVAAYGFTDRGYWFQGEITGGYPLSNSNLKSHMLRLQLFPNNNLVLNAIYYDFTLDQANVFGEPVGSTDWGDEVNMVADYAIADKWFLSGVFGWLVPGQAARNWTGGDKTWFYGMIYVRYTL